jgi:hypothetical protein
LANKKKFKLFFNFERKENKLKKIIEIKNLLLILKNMQNYIELLIRLRKKIILNKKIKIIKKMLAEQALELEENRLKKKIEIFNIENKNSIFPIKNYFFQKEILKFKEDFELMLSNCYNLFILIKDDLPFDQIEGNPLNIRVEEKIKSDLNNSILNNNKRNIAGLVESNFKNKLDLDESNLKNKNLLNKNSDKKNIKKNKSSSKNMFYLKYLNNNLNNNKLLKDVITQKNSRINKPKRFVGKVNHKLVIKKTKSKFEEAIINPDKQKLRLPIITLNNQNKKLNTYSSILTYAIEENKKKIVETFKNMIFKHKRFDGEVSIIKNRAPVNIIFYSKFNKPIISQYLKSISIYNRIIKGTFIYFSNSIGFFFKKKNYKKFKNIYKFLFFFFKTMYCLISKPVFVYKTDKIIIQLYYFLFIPLFYKSKILRKNYRFNKQMIIYKKKKRAQLILYKKYLILKKIYKNLKLKFH